MMPLTRGSAACGLVCMQSLLLAAGYDITAPVPEGNELSQYQIGILLKVFMGSGGHCNNTRSWGFP